jgi:Tfp pilus assembly protein PilO
MKFISSILFIIISIVLFFIFIDPTYGEIRQLRTDVATYNTALNNSTELQKTRDSLIETYKNVKTEDKDRLAHFLPSTIGNIELILEIEKLANLHGMPIGNIKFDTKSLESPNTTTGTPSGTTTDTSNVVVAETSPEDSLPYGIFPMQFIIEGKYDTFVAFLKDLEHNLRLVDIKSISFDVPPPNPPGETTDTSIYTYTVGVETYWLK